MSSEVSALSSSKRKQSPYVGYYRANGSRTASRIFEPNSNPHGEYLSSHESQEETCNL